MNKDSLKIVIPMAGLGTRLRPHTWSKPKQLISVAGKTVLDHLLDSLNTLPESKDIELVNIVGYLGDQIKDHIENHYPNLISHYVVQENPCGQSHAIKIASQYLHGPMLIVFADTLIETNLSFLENESADSIAWVKPVPDPRRFGVVDLDEDGCVKRLIEKPNEMTNNLAVVGFYYFANAEDLLSAIDEQMTRDLQINGEFFLADAINIMLERGLKMRSQQVDVWLDAGTAESLLETNKYLLEHGNDNHDSIRIDSEVVITPPVFIHPSANLKKTIIGPYVSIGAGCKVENSIIKDSILEDQSQATGVILNKSIVGRNANLRRRPKRINVGDDTEIII